MRLAGQRFLGSTFAKIFIILIVATNTARAQGKNPVVEARLVCATDAVHADAPARVAMVAQVAAGYHLNDHKPTLNYLIPTKFVAEPSEQFTVKNVIYPPGTPMKFVFSDVPLSVYQGKLVVGVLLQAAKTVPPGTYTLRGKFAYQACSDHACLAPTSVPVTATLKVVAKNVPLNMVESDVFKRIKFE